MDLSCERHFNLKQKFEGKTLDKKNFETSLTLVFNEETLSCIKMPCLLLKNSEIM